MAKVEKPIFDALNTRWQEDTTHLAQSIARYTRFVSTSKFILGGLSLLMILVIVLLPILNSDKEGLRIAFSNVSDRNESVPLMTNPTFQGVDEKKQPYYVTADSALQHDQHTIVISNVQADMLTDQQTWLSVKARQGNINNQAKQMQLTDDVRLFHQEGYEFRTPYVFVDMQARIAKGDQSVNGFGPLGTIKADRFYWDHDASILRFTGNVKMTIQRQNG